MRSLFNAVFHQPIDFDDLPARRISLPLKQSAIYFRGLSHPRKMFYEEGSRAVCFFLHNSFYNHDTLIVACEEELAVFIEPLLGHPLTMSHITELQN